MRQKGRTLAQGVKAFISDNCIFFFMKKKMDVYIKGSDATQPICTIYNFWGVTMYLEFFIICVSGSDILCKKNLYA